VIGEKNTLQKQYITLTTPPSNTIKRGVKEVLRVLSRFQHDNT
jgi:hypothetical protein